MPAISKASFSIRFMERNPIFKAFRGGSGVLGFLRYLKLFIKYIFNFHLLVASSSPLYLYLNWSLSKPIQCKVSALAYFEVICFKKT